MKILFLAPVVPYPPLDGDRQRAYHLLRLLSQRHETHLLCFCRALQEQAGLAQLAGVCRSAAGVWLSRSRIWGNCLAALPGRTPLNVAAFHSRTMAAAVAESVQRLGIDVVHAYRLRMAPYALHAGTACRVLDYTDAMTRYFQNRLQTAAGMGRYNPYLRQEAKRLAYYEPRVSHAFHACLISSPQDQALLESLGATGLHVVTNGVDTAAFQPRAELPAGPRLLFVGNCRYAANALGLAEFFRHTWPRIRQELPEVRLTLVGEGSQDRRFRHPGVEAAGRVPELAPYLQASRAAICPLQVASGRQFKVIEYLAAGLPTVTTPLVAANLDAVPGVHLLAANSAREFAAEVVRVCRDDALAFRLRQAGLAFASERYDWDVAQGQLDAVYGRLPLEACDSRNQHAQGGFF